ncbi:HAMP domain-containing histidine kinase [Candidatus Saccharibacteria bacterium]|nr:HAMP domain-containing histidine kinase [Candidatus Saccharibacteria bacterium]
MSVRDKIINKFTIMFAMIVVAIITVITAIYFYDEAIAEIGTRTIETVNTIAIVIPREDIAELAGDRSDLYRESYRNLKTMFTDLAEVNSQISFVWLMGVNDAGELFFYVDSDTSDEEALPGDIFPDTTDLMWETINTGETGFDGAATDEWGTWLSSYASITDEDGNFMALFGADVPNGQYVAYIISRVSLPIMTGVAFMAILYFVQLSMKRTRQQLEREKELLSVASHEVRSPMVSIKWVLDDMLKHPEGLSEQNRSLIAALAENATKIINGIEGILSSKSGLAVSHKSYNDVKIRAILEDIVGTLSIVAKEHQVTVKIDDTITADLMIRGNQDSLTRAFYNVVNNALKYTHPNTEVEISYARSEKYNHIMVSDHGPGVKPEDRERIFEGMYRTEEAMESKQQGTGLGLYFVKKIVDDHEGKIYIDPNYTDGARIVIELPV